MSKKKAIYIRVEPLERKHIQAAAKEAGISVSKLGAALLLSFAFRRKELREIIARHAPSFTGLKRANCTIKEDKTK